MTGLEEGQAAVNGIRMHYVRRGSGPLLLLVHGWPQTWYCWRKIIPQLSEYYTVVAPDLRGYGLTDKPRNGYDKRTMASDLRALVRHLGYERAILVGHDRGARVAQRYGLDYPDAAEKMAMLDVIPTHAVWERVDSLIALGYWHWFFHLQPDLPELLVGRDIEGYLRYFFERWATNRPSVEEAIPEYVQAFCRPGALRAGFDDYRATFPEDVEADAANVEAGQKLKMPVLLLWGSDGLVGRLPVLDIWAEYAEDATGDALRNCGHFLAEEKPREVVDQLLAFLRPGVC